MQPSLRADRLGPEQVRGSAQAISWIGFGFSSVGPNSKVASALPSGSVAMRSSIAVTPCVHLYLPSQTLYFGTSGVVGAVLIVWTALHPAAVGAVA